MGLHRAPRQGERFGDRYVGQPLRHELQDGAFPVGEGSQVVAVAVTVQELVGDEWVDDRPAGGHGAAASRNSWLSFRRVTGRLI